MPVQYHKSKKVCTWGPVKCGVYKEVVFVFYSILGIRSILEFLTILEFLMELRYTGQHPKGR